MPERGETGLPYQEVAIGEDFFPFAHGESDNSVILIIEGIPPIPVYFADPYQARQKFNTLTPYDTKEGYPISLEDFDLDKRLEKLEVMRHSGEAEKYIYDGKLMRFIWAYTETEELEAIGIARETGNDSGDIFEIKPDSLALLRLKVMLPMKIAYGSEQLTTIVEYEARLNKTSWEIGALSFDHFYPGDSGPLVTNEMLQHEYHAYEGFTLCIPDDPKIRSQISFKFILRGQNQDSTENKY